VKAPTLDEVRGAQARIAPHVLRTPLVALPDTAVSGVHLKLENLQAIGSFKLRGALSRILAADKRELADGVYTASAGNMAQGVAFAARMLGVKATAVVPETAPAAKIDAIVRLGAEVMRVPYDEWWAAMRDGGRSGMRGVFVHPFADPHVMAGNGSIALEILESLPDADALLIPWGGGGLACGIAAAARAVKPGIRVFACEVEGAAPLAASIAAGKPVNIDNKRSFIDGIGGRGVFPQMWDLARDLIAGSVTVTVEEVAQAVALLAKRAHVVAEGAGAAPVAVALASKIHPAPQRLVCVVSGATSRSAWHRTCYSCTRDENIPRFQRNRVDSLRGATPDFFQRRQDIVSPGRVQRRLAVFRDSGRKAPVDEISVALARVRR
jgi:threonine dehydratase